MKSNKVALVAFLLMILLTFSVVGWLAISRNTQPSAPSAQPNWQEEFAANEEYTGLFATKEDNLTALPPEVFQNAYKLQELGIADAQIEAIPPTIGQLVNLRMLDIHSSGVKVIPAEIGQLTNLKELLLYDNQITSIPSEIGSLEALEVLDLRGNQLITLPPTITNLVNLKRLHLGGNPLDINEVEQLKQALPNTSVNF